MILERISHRASSPLAAYDLRAFLPALRFLTGPFPPGVFAARLFAAAIFPPLLLVLFFAIRQSRTIGHAFLCNCEQWRGAI